MQIRVPIACARNGKRKANESPPHECSDHLAADFAGDDKHANWYQVCIGKTPNLALQIDACFKLGDLAAMPQFDGILQIRVG